MVNDRSLGFAIVAVSIFGILAYGWLLWSFPTMILQLTAFLTVSSVLGIVAWIGFTMFRIKPREPIDIQAPSVSGNVQAIQVEKKD